MPYEAGFLTRKEILSQPEIWAKALDTLESSGFGMPDTMPAARGLFVGAGTSLYLSRSLAHLGRALTGAPLAAVPPSDLLVCSDDYVTGEIPWTLGISRSGTTTETVRALELMRNRYNADTYALTCHSSAPMALGAKSALAVDDAAEESVVMTRSFTTMHMALTRWMLEVSRHAAELESQRLLPEAGRRLMDGAEVIVSQALDRFQPQHIVTFGQGANYGLACEVALKVKEMAIMPSEPFHTLEYRHGPKSIAGPGTLIVALLSDRGGDLERAVLKEMHDLGASVWAFAESAEGVTEKHADMVTLLGSGLPETVRLPLMLPILQLYGLELALSRGQDPDNPKNLTQVVTL